VTQLKMPRRGGRTAKRRALYSQTALDERSVYNKSSSPGMLWYKLWQPDNNYELELYGPTIRVAYCFSSTSGDLTEAAEFGCGLLLDRVPGSGTEPTGSPTTTYGHDERWLTRHFLPYCGRQFVPLSTEFKLRYLKLTKQEGLYIGLQNILAGQGPTLYFNIQTTAGYRVNEVHDPTDIR